MALATAALVAGGVKLVGGAIQAISGASKERSAERALQNLQTPAYTESPQIKDYYLQALQRYGINPFQTNQYQNTISQIGRNQAGAISALQDRNGAIGGIGKIVALSNNAAVNAGNAATTEQNTRFTQLGGAAGQEAEQQQLGYQYNQLLPYQKQLQILGLKAGGGAKLLNAGLTNAYGGLNDIGSSLTPDDGTPKPQNNGFIAGQPVPKAGYYTQQGTYQTQQPIVVTPLAGQ